MMRFQCKLALEVGAFRVIRDEIVEAPTLGAAVDSFLEIWSQLPDNIDEEASFSISCSVSRE